MSRRGWLRQDCVLSPLLFNMIFVAVIHVVLVRFSEGEDIVGDLVHLEEGVAVGNEVLLACVRRAVWGMLFADDAGIVSRSAEGLANMMSHRDCLGSSRPHDIRKEDGDDVVTNTGANVPGSTGRHGSSWPEVQTDQPVHTYNVAASSTKSLTSRSKSNDGSVSCGNASNGSARSCMIGRQPHLV